MPSVLVSLSGGLDSAVVLAQAVEVHAPSNVDAVGFRYGSYHNNLENEAARALASHYGVRFDLVDLQGVSAHLSSALLAGSGRPIPEGHYNDDSMKQTVVPGRNMLFASVLAGIADSRGISEVRMGVHAGDHQIYPDCRQLFFHYMTLAVLEATEKRVLLEAPLIAWNKSRVVQEGASLGVPFQLTRTCYTANPQACGRCGSCRERLEAFIENGMLDPIGYAVK